MSTQIAQVAVSLGDDPAEIRPVYDHGSFGEFAMLAVGDRLRIHIGGSTPEALLALAKAAAELATWLEQQQAAKVVAA